MRPATSSVKQPLALRFVLTAGVAQASRPASAATALRARSCFLLLFFLSRPATCHKTKGLYVVDEANIESHGVGFEAGTTLASRADFEAAHLARVAGVVERDKNHACVVVWSLGNEAGNGLAFHKAHSWVKRRDPTRPAQYENARAEAVWSQERVETLDENSDL